MKALARLSKPKTTNTTQEDAIKIPDGYHIEAAMLREDGRLENQ